MKTVPTGFVGVPPSGPAMPVMASPHGAPARVAIPRAIASAHGALTAPCVVRIDSGTPSSSSFARFEYTRTPRSKYAEEPGTLVSRWPRSPPVHDSATASVSLRSSSMRPTTSSRVSPSRPKQSPPRMATIAASALARLRAASAGGEDGGHGHLAFPAQPVDEPLLDIGEAEAGRPECPNERGPTPARPRARERRQMLLDHRLDAGVAGKDREGARAALESPPGFAVGRDPHRGALRQERQALRPSGQRSVEPPVALLERGKETLVEHEPRAAHARQHAAHDVTGRASAAREHHRQRLVGPERDR